MESFKPLGRTCQSTPGILHLRHQSIYASSPQTHPSAQKLVPGIAPDFSFIFLFHLVASLCASDCDSNSSSVASKKAAYTSYIPLPPMSLIGHNLSLGLQQGSIDLVSASRNTVLHSCRFGLNEPVSPNLLLNVYWDGVINWLLLNHLKLRRGKHRLVAWQWRSTDHS